MLSDHGNQPMRVLTLINAAKEHPPFYKAMGDHLAARGHELHYAIDSHYSDNLYPKIRFGVSAHYFSDYFRLRSKEILDVPEELNSEALWKLFFPDLDRFQYSMGSWRRDKSYYKRAVVYLTEFFDDLFTRIRPHAVVYENVSNAFSYFAYRAALRHGATYVGITQSRLPGRLDAYDCAPSKDSRISDLYFSLSKGELEPPPAAREYVAEYIREFVRKVPDYLHDHFLNSWPIKRYGNWRSVQTFLRSVRYFMENRTDHYYAFQVSNPLISFPEQIGREVIRQAKVTYLSRYHFASQVDLTQPFFVYPLQFHPESACSVDGPYSNDEWTNICNVALSLPFGVQLYVKDHPHAVGRQPLSFYERVNRLPNVVLVNSNFDVKVLLQHCKALVCSTSSMGFEAIVLGKPVYVLGHPFYEFHPLCVPIRSWEDAVGQFARFSEVRASPREIEAMVLAYYMVSHDGSFDIIKQVHDPAASEWIARVIEERTYRHLAGHQNGERSECASVSGNGCKLQSEVLA